MANLKSLRNRIRSVKNTQQITKAMKMVSAAKLRRSQERAQSARPYSQHIRRMIGTIAAQMDPHSAPALLAPAKGKRVELLVFTADRGLCGSFNSTIIRSVRAKIKSLQEGGHTVTITCVGRKGLDVLKRQFKPLIRRSHIGMARNLTFARVDSIIATRVLSDFGKGEFDTCLMVYNTFKSALNVELTWKQIIPMTVDSTEVSRGSAPMYEPEEAEVLTELLPHGVSMQLYQAMVESDASEQGARMTAMDNAVRNAGDMIRKLGIKYNRTRQAAITTELMEIIGGAESLKG
ncbi:MAG: F0F1 ATP synthase subunit gamma [Magnetococcales bacterium]|nr:F0F1 ATP synthase subunit gamma [Magnetococcales bacterium]MBF0149307.1 F0F1 ATP synthase subunit gamma [Magnetococcales bacterium]MBF0172318.1 F0F1 ATP synthase subunit gamma [Magnetococcales bacterium]MBF0348518.1 F0F1 ATP synthase subunit gamma [Magnetococcales bacterium]MBF0630665.1 F0F1 ATP synthase subunit gamma [Magnetococcales bacterium]